MGPAPSRVRAARRYNAWSMKTAIHPSYVQAHVRCTCGNEFTTRATREELHVEVCSNCHPFYTGRQKLVDTGGRVERFQRRVAKSRLRQAQERVQTGAPASAPAATPTPAAGPASVPASSASAPAEAAGQPGAGAQSQTQPE